MSRLMGQLNLPLPNKPDTNDPVEMRRWIDSMYDWLQRFRSQFTQQNISGSALPTPANPALPAYLVWNETTRVWVVSQPADYDTDYFPGWDGTSHEYKWIETTTECP